MTIFTFFSFWCALPALLIGMNMPQATSWIPEHFFIATTMLVVGAVSVMTWDSALPDRRDVLVLAPLPVRPSTLFAAKIAALFAAPGLAIFALNVFTGIDVAAGVRLPQGQASCMECWHGPRIG